MDVIQNMLQGNLLSYALVILVAVGVSIASFALLIPLDSVPAVSGVTIIIIAAYVISFLAWAVVMTKYAKDVNGLALLNTHLMFFVLLPATIGATAMNVVSIQNTRNMLAGNITGSA